MRPEFSIRDSRRRRHRGGYGKAARLLSAILVDLCGVNGWSSRPSPPSRGGPLGFAYIGGHPMAGRETAGFRRHALYGGRVHELGRRTPTRSCWRNAKAFFLDVGFAGADLLRPQEHDRIIAFTSRAADIASSAYVNPRPAAQVLRRELPGTSPGGPG